MITISSEEKKKKTKLRSSQSIDKIIKRIEQLKTCGLENGTDFIPVIKDDGVKFMVRAHKDEFDGVTRIYIDKVISSESDVLSCDFVVFKSDELKKIEEMIKKDKELFMELIKSLPKNNAYSNTEFRKKEA